MLVVQGMYSSCGHATALQVGKLRRGVRRQVKPILMSRNIFHLPIDAIFSRRYSVRIILVLNDVLRTTRPASPPHGFELARKDATLLAAQPSEPRSRQSNKVQHPQAASAVYCFGAAESNGGK
jgi:hypothetical protein